MRGFRKQAVGTTAAAWLSKGVLKITVPLVTIKQESKTQAHRIFVQEASSFKLCQVKKGNFQKDTLSGTKEKNLLEVF